MILELSNVSLHYGPIQAVRGLSMTVDEGEIVAIVGRNGAGKTTTLNGISGVHKPARGDIIYQGDAITRTKIHSISRRGLAYVPEGRGVFGGLSVMENLQTSAYGHGLAGKSAKAEIERALAYFPVLDERRGQAAGTMSGGEQQMLVLARALVGRPSLLLLDEPGLGLSPLLVSEVYKHLVRFNREDGMSILLVEQYVELAMKTADRAYVLAKGEVAASGTSDELARSGALIDAYVN